MAPWPAKLAEPGNAVRTWHFPVFFLGFLTLVAVLTLRPWLLRGSEGRQVARQLAEARHQLDRREIDLDRVLELTQPARDAADHLPQLSGEGYFLAGSAQLRVAERDSKTPNSDNARLACSYLEQAEAFGVPAADRAKLSYRLGKAWYLTSHDPAAIIERWKDTIAEGADDPAEGYDLLSHVYLRLPEPDVVAALAANGKLLQLPLDADTILAPARLFRGELYLRLHQPEAAREVLKKLGAHAPPGLAAHARFLRAGCLEEEGAWNDALLLWREVMADKAAPPKQPDLAEYHIGLCHRKLDESAEAAKAWQECLRIAGNGDAGVAAALGLAGLRLLKDHNPQAALEAYSQVVRDVKGPADWRNGLVSLSGVREEFESGCHILRETREYSFAIQLADLYDKLAPAGKAQELRGSAARQWAFDRFEAARKSGVSPTDRAAWEEEAQARYRQAGEAYAKAAEQTPAPADQADRLWMSVTCFLDGHDAARAVPVLERFLKLDNPAERAGEAWCRLAEAQAALHNEEASEAAYKKATEYPGRGAAPARLQLALAAIAKGDFAIAEALLDENVDHANKDVDEETARRSLFALGNVHLQRRSLQSAILRLEQAMHEYPTCKEMNQARYQLAECFRLQAEEAFQGSKAAKLPESREFYLKQHREYLAKAVTKYQELADDLGARSRDQSLSKDEEEVYWIAAFNSAHGCYFLGQYDKACKLFEGLAARYHDRPESLDALAWVARCWLAKGDSAKGNEAVKRVETALRELDDAKFSKELGAVDRKKWEAWVKEAYKSMGQP